MAHMNTPKAEKMENQSLWLSLLLLLKDRNDSVGIDSNVLNRYSWALCDGAAEVSAVSGRMYQNILPEAG